MHIIDITETTSQMEGHRDIDGPSNGGRGINRLYMNFNWYILHFSFLYFAYDFIININIIYTRYVTVL